LFIIYYPIEKVNSPPNEPTERHLLALCSSTKTRKLSGGIYLYAVQRYAKKLDLTNKTNYKSAFLENKKQIIYDVHYTYFE
jgi:hypothetical protein